MKSKILISIMTIALVASLAGTGLYALFSDTETSTGNTFTAGTLDLSIAAGTGALPFTFTNMKPGDIVSNTIIVTNVGSLGGTLYGRCSYTELVDPIPLSDLGDVLDVTSWNDPQMGAPINPGMTLKAFVAQTGVTVTGFGGTWMPYGTLASTATGTFDMTVTFNTAAGNQYQGDSIDMTFEFLLVQ